MTDSLTPFSADDLLAASAPAPSAAPAAAPGSYSDVVGGFVSQYLPLAQRVSDKTGVAPNVLLGQWGLETGWGRSVVPGTNNLGNIKDTSGAGAAATDNQTGSRDKYRTYADPDAFGDDYTSLLGNRYQAAVGTGSDAGRFFGALKQGGYAQDPGYVQKGVAASQAAAQAMGGTAAPAQRSYYSAPAGDSYVAIPPPKQSATGGDYAKELVASALEGIGSIGQGAGEIGAAVANKATDSEDYVGKNLLTPAATSLRGSMTQGGKDAMQDAQIQGDAAAILTGDWNSVQLPTTAQGWGMLAVGGLGSLAPVLLPVVGTAGRAASLARAAEAATAAGDLAKAAGLAKAAQAASTTAKVAGATTNALMMGGGSAESARADVGRQVASMTHDQLMQQVPVYAQAYSQTGDEQQARQAVVNSAARWAGGFAAAAAAAGGGFNSKVLEDVLVGKGSAALLGKAADSRVARVAIGGGAGSVGGALEMGAMKAGQNAGENVAMGRPASDDLTRNMAGDLINGALLGGPAGALGGLAAPHEQEAKAPAPAPAPAPNSPLLNAANSGGAAKAAADAVAAEQVDPISAKVDDIKQRVQQGGLLHALRSSDSPVNTKQFLDDLAEAGSASTEPQLREQAMSRLEFALGWADQNAPAAVDTAAADAAAAGSSAPRSARTTPQQRQAAIDLEAKLQAQLKQAQTPGMRDQIQREIERNRRDNLGAPVLASGDPTAAPVEFDPSDPTTSAGAAGFEGGGAPANGAEAQPGEFFDTGDLALGESPPATGGPGSIDFDGAHIPTDGLALTPKDSAATDTNNLDFDRSEPTTSPGAAPEAGGEPAGTNNAVEPPDHRFNPALDTSGLALVPKQSATEARAEIHQRQTDEANDAAADARAQQAQEHRAAEEQSRAQAADAADQRAAARPAADVVVAALRAEPFQRTAEQKAVITRARATYAPEDMAVLERAGRTPFALTAAERVRLGELRNTTPDGAAARSPAAPAFMRKRRDQLKQMAALGFDTVERRPDGFHLTNSRTGQVLKLGGMADAQLARQAIREHIDEQAHQASTSPSNDLREPTDAQKQAGNYKKGHIANLNGVRVSIENPSGSVRRGVAPDGKPWQTTLAHHYGDIEGTHGADGDPVDVFIGPRPDSKKIFVVDQRNPDGSFDEHKVMMGFTSEEAARQGYLANYDKGWDGLMAITAMSPEEFKAWVNSDAAQRPAYESTPGRVTLTDGGREIAVPLVHDDQLPEKRTDASAVTRGQAQLLRKVASVFGKRVQFFDDPAREIMSDGFVRAEDPATIYLNRKTSVSALSVFGHELMHLLRRENPRAYDAVAAAVQARLKDGDGFLRYYGDTSLGHDAMLEELVGDLNGDLMRDGKFWREVFDEITQAHGDDAKGIIASLAEVLNRLFTQLVEAFKGERGFESQRFIQNAHELRDEFRKALAAYGRDQGISKAAMQAEILRMQQRAKADAKSADIDRSRQREDFDDPAGRVEVSTTVPTAKKGGQLVNDAVGQKWIIDQSDIEQAKQHAAAAEAAIRSYNAVSVERKQSAFEALRHVVTDNLTWLYDKVPAAVRERAKLWYDGANRIATGWAKQFHLDERQVAGVLAVLSPQKDWFMNVSLAERLIRVYQEHRNEPWSPAMTQWVRSYIDASKTVKEKADRAGLLSDAVRLQGTTMAEMSDRDAARFLRVFDETYFPRSYRVVTPEGGFGDYVTKASDEVDEGADETVPGNVAWGKYPTIEKAVAILRAKPSDVFSTVSANLGSEHKVRNFYNNIIRPNSADGHVTIDTHAVAAAFIKALSGNSTEVKHNFGGTLKGEGGAGANAASGASGLYGAFADAYREAAARAGVLPREMQSITWEAIRSIFQPSFKSKRAGDVEGVFNRYKAGEITREQARDQAYEMAGGIKSMPWEGTPEGRFVGEGGSSFDAELHEDPAQRAARQLEPRDAKDKVAVTLSAATHSIPGLAELHRLAGRGDTLAHDLLQQVALDNLKHLLAGTSARVKDERATGLYGGEAEPSLSLNITFTDADRSNVLAGLAKFAENFNQEQVHVRQATTAKKGVKFDDGSYVTPVYRWALDAALSRKQIQRVIDQSGLYGLTFGDDFVEAYYVGDVSNEQQTAEFYRNAGVADGLLAKAGGRVSVTRARLWPYGHGDGAIGYERIRGDVAAGPALSNATAKRVAEYLNADGDKPGKVKAFEQAKEITPKQAAKQREIAQRYDALPDNDLGNPRVRRAYSDLAKEVVRQFKALPVKVEVFTGKGEPYKSSADMRRDVLDNNHLYIFGTTPETFGPEGVDFSGHPLLEPSGLKDINGHPLLMNDLLRAVHDYYAHTMSPVEFGPKGEEAAWLNHMAMTRNPWARWALTSETRGQNSFVNFRDDLDPSTPIKDRPFARQKAALLPIEHSLTGDRMVDKPMKELIDQLPERQRAGSLQPMKKSLGRPDDDKKPVFYGQLEHAIAGVPDRLATMSAPQWSQWLKANAGKLGVKADEITWSGIDEYLKLRGKDKISRAELAQWVAGNGVKVDEVVLGNGGLTEAEIKEVHELRDLYRRSEQGEDGVFDPSDFDRLQELEERKGGDSLTKYGQYTLPGGENYRELLLTLPERRPLTKAWRDAQEQHGDDDPRTIAAKKAARAEANGPANKYKSSHWDAPNVLAHIRFNERTDADGKRVLFIEEVQSDWGQEGKKKGFAGKADIGVKRSAEEGADEDTFDVVVGGKVVGYVHADDEAKALAQAERKFGDSKLTDGVPAAPFVTDTKAWLSLALKRMLRWAVDHGMDRVAFTTGEQNANRYDLSKQVERIDAMSRTAKTGEIFYNIDVATKSGQDFNRDGLTASELEDTVGKEMARKIAEATKKQGIKARFSGLDLKIGGEGMKAFYDQIVPQVAGSLVKKLGGDGMREVSIGTKTLGVRGRTVVDTDTGDVVSSHGNQQNAIKALAASRTKQPGFDITPAMAQKIAGGQALFSRRRDADPRLLSWAQATRRLQDAGYSIDHNEWGAPIVKKDGAEVDYAAMPRELREAWNALSTDDPGEPDVHDFDAERKLQGMVRTGAAMKFSPERGDDEPDPTSPSGRRKSGSPDRGDFAWQGTERADGGPEYFAKNFALVDPIKLKADDFAGDDEPALPLGHASHMGDGNEAYQWRVAGRDGRTLGMLAGQVDRNGEISAIHDIAIDRQRSGVGRDVVAHIAANHRGDVKVVEAIPQSQGFWDKMGAGYYDVHRNATLDWDTLSRGLAREDEAPEGEAAAGSDEQVPAGEVAELDPEEAKGLKFSPQRAVTESPEFKRWFDDSKVVDKRGNPLVAYHGTNVEFDKFDIDGANEVGSWFTAPAKRHGDDQAVEDARGAAEAFAASQTDLYGGNDAVMPVYLSIKNPKVFRGYGGFEKWSSRSADGAAIRKALIAEGYDGIVVRDSTTDSGELRDDWVAFSPEQIKSAIGNNGNFDRVSQDIVKSPERGDPTQTEAFKRWFGDSQVVDESGKPIIVYHGTAEDFSEFDAEQSGRNYMGNGGREGFFFTSNPGTASVYAEQPAGAHLNHDQPEATDFGDGTANIMPVFLRIEHPLITRTKNSPDKFFDRNRHSLYARAKAAGADGIIVRGGGDTYKRSVYVAFEPEQIKSAIGNDGSFDPSSRDITKSSARTVDVGGKFTSESVDGQTTAREGWDTPSASRFDDMVYRLQDKHVDTKRVVDAIKETAGAIKDDLDVYLQEELFHGRAAKRTEDFVHGELQPLVEQMKSAGLSISELDDFLHARHAREANEVIRQRNPEMKDSGSGMSDQDAAAYFAELPAAQRAKLEAAAAHVDAMLRKTNGLLVDYELESAETVHGWTEMFQHYVPLMREDDGRHVGNGTGQGFSIKGREVKSRTGSTRKVVDILANIAMQRERTIVRGEKNRIARALLGLAKANPNKDFWHVDSVPKNQVFNKDKGVVEERPDPLFKQRDNVLVAKVAHPGGIHEHAVIFNEKDERAMRMAQALKNLDAARLEGVLGVSAKVTRYFAAVNTQYNPVFGVVNLIRDVQESLVNLQTTELAGQQKKVARYTLGAIRGIYSDLRGVRKGDHAEQGEWGKLWEDFQEAGGQTGYRQMFASSSDRAKAIERALDPEAWMNSKLGKIFTANGSLKVPMAVAQRGAKWMFDWLSDYNESMENGVRLAAYKAGLEAGMSRDRAASLAKNLTVNFNRKGQVAQQAGALYAFFNASMQGTARLASTLFTMEPGKPKTIRLSSLGKKIVLGGMLLGTVQAMAMAAAGFNDDDPPEFMRENGLIIPIGGKKYVTIPMPAGLRIIPSIGRVTTQWALSGFKRTPQRTSDLLSLFADSFNPIGNAGMSMQTLAPTAFDPLVALTENKDFTGRPIAKESHNKATPGPALVRDTASTVGKLISEGINHLSGGTQYTAGVVSPTPDQIDYLIGQVTGGVGRELNKLEQSALGTARGEDVPLYKVPLAGRFVGDAAGQASEGTEFYANTDRLNQVDTEAKGMRADGKSQEANQVRASHPESYLITMANHAERAIQKLRQQKSQLIKDGAPREQVTDVEGKITARMAALNRAMERLQIK